MSSSAVVAPLMGWRAPGAGRAAHRHPVTEYQATTVQACGLFPFTAGSGAPAVGVPFGRHMTWGEVVCCDPFAWMDAGLTTNRGVFLLGQPGTGKSSAGKRIGRGLDRINPLDAGPLGAAAARLTGPAATRLRTELRGRRINALLALCSLVR